MKCIYIIINIAKVKVSVLLSFSFRLFDFDSEDKYVASLDIEVCLEKENCQISVPVLDHTTIPTALCDLDQGFGIKGKKA